MAARLQISGGQAHGTEHWIEEDVLRIGSSPASDFVVPEAASHGVTLQFRQNQYWIYNRSSESVYLNGRPVTGERPTTWKEDQVLELTGDVSLQLRVDQQPAPSAAPSEWMPVDEPPEVAEDEVVEEQKTSLTQLLVIGACGVVIALMLMDIAVSPEKASIQQKFEGIVQTLAQVDSATPWVRVVLQEARYYERRGDFKLAMERYGHIRDTLLTRRAKSELDEIDQQVYALVKERINEIASKATTSKML